MVRAFYCSPRKAEELGYTITKQHYLSNSDAKDLRDEYDKYEQGYGWSVSIVTGVLGIAVKSTIAIIGFVVSSTTALTIASDLFMSLDNDFDAIATSGNKINKVVSTYKYRRHGSNDGAYFLSSIKLA